VGAIASYRSEKGASYCELPLLKGPGVRRSRYLKGADKSVHFSLTKSVVNGYFNCLVERLPGSAICLRPNPLYLVHADANIPVLLFTLANGFETNRHLRLCMILVRFDYACR